DVPVTQPLGGLEPNTTYHFRFVATNGTGTTDGPDATFTTTTSNDNFAQAIDLTPQGASGTTTRGNIGATVEQGEPTRLVEAGVPTTKTVWWKWTAPSTGTFRFDTHGSNFDTTLGIFTGPSVDQLHEVTSNDNDIQSSQSVVRFHATSGVTYF